MVHGRDVYRRSRFGTRAAVIAAHTDAEMVEVRRDEQRRAAELGGFGAVVQLGHPSGDVKSADGVTSLADELASILEVSPSAEPLHAQSGRQARHPSSGDGGDRARGTPTADDACDRRGSSASRGGATSTGWATARSCGSTPRRTSALAQQFAAVYESQIDGAKRYDVAIQGRRRANATMHGIRSTDDAEEVIVAIDLTPLLRNDDLDPVEYTLAAIDRLRADVETSLRRWFN